MHLLKDNIRRMNFLKNPQFLKFLYNSTLEEIVNKGLNINLGEKNFILIESKTESNLINVIR
jgi:hypothetical protein